MFIEILLEAIISPLISSLVGLLPLLRNLHLQGVKSEILLFHFLENWMFADPSWPASFVENSNIEQDALVATRSMPSSLPASLTWHKYTRDSINFKEI